VTGVQTCALPIFEELLERKVFLRTFVKVVPGWTKDAEKVRRLVRDGTLP
jgi:GTPase Era involved in 16S rRNA processing